MFWPVFKKVTRRKIVYNLRQRDKELRPNGFTYPKGYLTTVVPVLVSELFSNMQPWTEERRGPLGRWRWYSYFDLFGLPLTLWIPGRWRFVRGLYHGGLKYRHLFREFTQVGFKDWIPFRSIYLLTIIKFGILKPYHTIRPFDYFTDIHTYTQTHKYTYVYKDFPIFGFTILIKR